MKETNWRARFLLPLPLPLPLLLLLLLLQFCQRAHSIGNIGSAGVGVGVGSGVGLQCQRIAVSACQGLGYNMTALPNLAGHTNQLEAELQVSKHL